MHPITHECFTSKKPIFAFPYSTLKDKHVSCSSLCYGSCKCRVHTIWPNTFISKYCSTDVSILNTYLQISSKWCSLYVSLSVGSPNLYFDTWQNILLCVSMAAYKLATLSHTQWYLCTLYVPIFVLCTCTHVPSTIIQLVTPSLLGHVTDLWLKQISCFLVLT